MKQYGYVFGTLLVVFVVGYSVGRYAAPAKIQEKIVEKEVEKKDNNIRTVTVVVEKPDGTKTSTTTQDDKSTDVVNDSKSDSASVANLPDWKVSGGLGYNFKEISSVYMVGVERRIIGSIALGVFGVTDGTIGLSVSVGF